MNYSGHMGRVWDRSLKNRKEKKNIIIIFIYDCYAESATFYIENWIWEGRLVSCMHNANGTSNTREKYYVWTDLLQIIIKPIKLLRTLNKFIFDVIFFFLSHRFIPLNRLKWEKILHLPNILIFVHSKWYIVIDDYFDWFSYE